MSDVYDPFDDPWPSVEVAIRPLPAVDTHAILVEIADLADVLRRVESKIDFLFAGSCDYTTLCEALGQPYVPTPLPPRKDLPVRTTGDFG